MNGDNGFGDSAKAKVLIVGGVMFLAAFVMIVIVVILAPTSGQKAVVDPVRPEIKEAKALAEPGAPRRLPLVPGQTQIPQPEDPGPHPKTEEPAPEVEPDTGSLMGWLEWMLANSQSDNYFRISGNIAVLENTLLSWLHRAPPWFAELNADKLMSINFMLNAAKIDRAWSENRIEADQAILMLNDLINSAPSRLNPALLEEAGQRLDEIRRILAGHRENLTRFEVRDLEGRAVRILAQSPAGLSDPVATYNELVEIVEKIEQIALFYPAANEAAGKIKGNFKPFYNEALAREMKDSFRSLDRKFFVSASVPWVYEALDWLEIFDHEGRPDFLKTQAIRLNNMVSITDLRQRLDSFENRIQQNYDKNPELALRINGMAMSEACAMMLEARNIGNLSESEQNRLATAYKILEAREKNLLETAHKSHMDLIRAYNLWAVAEIDAARKLKKQYEEQIARPSDKIFDSLLKLYESLSQASLNELYKPASKPSTNAKASYSGEDYHKDLVIICNLLNAIDLGLLDKPVLDFYHLVYDKVKANLDEDLLHVIAVNALKTEKRPLQENDRAQ